MTLNSKNGSLQPLVEGKERKMQKATALALLSLNEKGEKLVFWYHKLWERGEAGAG